MPQLCLLMHVVHVPQVWHSAQYPPAAAEIFLSGLQRVPHGKICAKYSPDFETVVDELVRSRWVMILQCAQLRMLWDGVCAICVQHQDDTADVVDMA